jgi:NTE family protein
MGVDLVLSGGYLAFAEQAGFLRAVEDVGLEVDAVCGTSSGALAGALWAAGMPASTIFTRLTARSPIRRMRPSRRPWRGVFSMRPVVTELALDLPPAFSDLRVPFAAGVVDRRRRFRLLHDGPLPQAVAASCAIPGLFPPVRIGTERWADGGVTDRCGLDDWRRTRPDRRIVLHWVDSSRPCEPVQDPAVTVIRSPAAGASFLGLGDVHRRYYATREATRAALTAAG